MTAIGYDVLTADLIRRTCDATEALTASTGRLPDAEAVVSHMERHLPAGYSGALADDDTRREVLTEFARVILRSDSA